MLLKRSNKSNRKQSRKLEKFKFFDFKQSVSSQSQSASFCDISEDPIELENSAEHSSLSGGAEDLCLGQSGPGEMFTFNQSIRKKIFVSADQFDVDQKFLQNLFSKESSLEFLQQ